MEIPPHHQTQTPKNSLPDDNAIRQSGQCANSATTSGGVKFAAAGNSGEYLGWERLCRGLRLRNFIARSSAKGLGLEAPVKVLQHCMMLASEGSYK